MSDFLKWLLRCWGMVLMVSLSMAQPAVTRSDVWRVGETVQFYGYQAEGVEPGPAGNGVTWSFSNLQRDGDASSRFTYLDPSGLPGADLFPDANLAAQTEFEPNGFLYVFTKITEEGVVDYGQVTPVGSVVFEDPRQVLKFPLAYDTQFQDSFRGTLSVMAGGTTLSGERTGSIEVHYDGFGTFEFGSKTFTQVRRMKQVQTVTDSFVINGVTTEATSITTTYAYLGRESGTAFFQYHIIELIQNGQRTVSRQISAQDLEPSTSQPLTGQQGVHLTAQAGTFATEILIHNPNESPQTMQFHPRTGDGQELNAITLELAADSVTRMGQAELFPEQASSFSMEGCNSCSVSLGYRSTQAGGSTAHVHRFSQPSTEFLFYPGEWEWLFDGAALVNTGSEPAIVELSQLDSNGGVLEKVTLANNLSPGAKYLNIFNGVFAQQADGLLKLESNQPLAVMILRISLDNRFLYQNAPLPVPGNGKRWLPHLTSNSGGFKTQVLIHNTSANDQMVTLQPYDASGVTLEPQSVLVPGGWTRHYDKEALLPDAATHALVSGASECIVSVGYQSVLPQASTAQIHESPAIASAIEIYTGEWDVLFDGLAVVNSGTESAVLTAIQIADNGMELGRVILAQDLAPNSKFLGVLEGLFQLQPHSRIRLEASQPIAVLTLRLSKDSRYLYGNAPIP